MIKRSRKQAMPDIIPKEFIDEVLKGCGVSYGRFHQCGKLYWFCDSCRRINALVEKYNKGEK